MAGIPASVTRDKCPPTHLIGVCTHDSQHVGYVAVHEKLETNRAATTLMEIPHTTLEEGRKKAKLKGRKKLEREADTRVPQGRESPSHLEKMCP
ncbi:hypothetical protein AVEN_246092-1 [Araneus ventricosus]|uniref:Uncharacterized protein n=1 Tax=Araneus ventricosus TaxID=182803 RepID=A0A4Y2UFG3_ARAVE|nr:hypothetical protein AVEN_246092-1 [Araneus ventricosus]